MRASSYKHNSSESANARGKRAKCAKYEFGKLQSKRHSENTETNMNELRGAEAGSSIKPVVFSQLVNFDALPLLDDGRWKGHSGGAALGTALGTG